MASPTKINFKLYQGSTFSETLRWESSTKVYVPISNITKSAPMVVTAPNHGTPPGWRVKITGALGMKEANTGENYIVASDADTNTLTFNSINAIGFNTYTGNGTLEYNQPVSLVGFTGRMQLRARVEDPVVIHEMTTENSGILVNNITKTIVLQIPAATTAGFTFQTAVYSLELVNGSTVIPFANGTFTLIKEVTR